MNKCEEIKQELISLNHARGIPTVEEIETDIICGDCPQRGKYKITEQDGEVWYWCGECHIGG